MTRSFLNSTAVISALICTLAAPSVAQSTALTVTSSADAGAGTLRAALATASSRGTASQIIVLTDTPIAIDSTLEYTGTAPLTIMGRNQHIMTSANTTLLAAPNGADLTIVGLSLAGPSGFSVMERGDLDGEIAGKGIFVGVPTERTGTVSLTLRDVSVSGVANHGIHVSDCSLADDCGSGAGGAGEGSAASVLVTLNNVTVSDAGNGKFDADGLRVDERGAGSITLVANASSFTGVGADGVELDEGQDGDVIITVDGSDFSNNGAYCTVDLMAPFLPSVFEAEFTMGSAALDAIPPAITGAADDVCIERSVDLYDDGSVEAYEFAIDLDDGFDIDEAGGGSIIGLLSNSTINGNLDEGVDFDEEGAGDISVSYVNTRADGNTDDGFKHSEEDEGSVIAIVSESSAEDNGGKGFVFEESDAGDLTVTASGVSTNNNNDSDGTGFELVQEDAGIGAAEIYGSDIADGFDDEGVTLNQS